LQGGRGLTTGPVGLKTLLQLSKITGGIGIVLVADGQVTIELLSTGLGIGRYTTVYVYTQTEDNPEQSVYVYV
jgi:hypothetical protein